MGYSASYIIPNFVKHAGKPDGLEPGKRPGRDWRQRFPDGSGSSLYYAMKDGRVVELQSYGSHFPLARLITDKRGRRLRWILNGDRWSGGFGRTDEHNDMMRIAAQQSGVPWIILPFSALREAGINVDSIVPVEITEERWTWEERTARSLDDVPARYRGRRYWRDNTGREVTPPRSTTLAMEGWPDNKGGWYIQDRGINGWQRVSVEGPAYDGPLHSGYETRKRSADGLYHWEEERHWLSESLFRATYTTWKQGRGNVKQRRLFLSAFDENEPRPLYFLAELPADAHPRTIAEAREALKPLAVAKAAADGLDIRRQGDIFAIQQPWLTTLELPGPSQRSQLILDVNHRATEVRYWDGQTFARGKLYHARVPREHQTITLGDGKTWYRLVRNTVPHSFGTPRAWSLGGRVD